MQKPRVCLLFCPGKGVAVILCAAGVWLRLQAVTFCRRREIPFVVDSGMFRFNVIRFTTQSFHLINHGKNMNRKLFSTLAVSVISAGLAMSSGAAFAGTNEQSPKGKMAKIDTNGDGKISRNEAAPYPRLAKHFDQMDANKDGVLSQDELTAMRKKAAAARFKMLDADVDGRISRAEADAKAPRLSKHFDHIDANKDGFLSKDELAAVHKRAQAKH